MLVVPTSREAAYARYKAELEAKIEDDFVMIVKEDGSHVEEYKPDSYFPKGFLAWWRRSALEDKKENIPPEEGRHEKWFLQRFFCLFDHVFLSGHIEHNGGMEPILGMDFQEDPHHLLFSKLLNKRPGEYVTIPNPAPMRGPDDYAFVEVPYPLADLDTTFKKRMILWPRGLFKTSAIRVEIVQFILNYPDIRILFLTGGDKLAKQQLRAIKDFFEKPSRRFRFLFPEFCLKSVQNKRTNEWTDVSAKMGTQHEFTVPCRKKTLFAQPTFSISTAKSVKAGSHYDVIFVDDLVNEQNYRSETALEKCYEEYRAICPLLDPSGFMVLTGTRYSFGDTYQRIIEDTQKEEQKLGRTIWKFSIKDCWSEGKCMRCGHSQPWHDGDPKYNEPICSHLGCTCTGLDSNHIKGVLFPETRTFDGRSIGHTLAFLEGEKILLGPDFFANQYENRPMAAGSQTFTEALLSMQTILQLKDLPTYQQSKTFAVADLAYVGQEGRDYSVIFLCRVFRGQIFVYDCIFGNWDSGQVAENMCKVMLLHRPHMIFPEQFNGWEAYDTVIRSFASVRGIQNVPITWIKGSQQDKAKITRIGAIKGVLAARRLWLYAAMPGFETLREQLLKWPKLGRHDDFADCLGQVVAAPTGYAFENPPVTESALNWLHRLHQQNAIDDTYGDNGCGTGICC